MILPTEVVEPQQSKSYLLIIQFYKIFRYLQIIGFSACLRVIDFALNCLDLQVFCYVATPIATVIYSVKLTYSRPIRMAPDLILRLTEIFKYDIPQEAFILGQISIPSYFVKSVRKKNLMLFSALLIQVKICRWRRFNALN